MALAGLRLSGTIAGAAAPGVVLNTEGQSAYVFEKSSKPAVVYNPGVGAHINTGVNYADYQKAITASESNKFSFFRFTSEYRTVDKLLAKALGMETSQISGFFGKTLWGKGKVRSFLCDLVYKYHLPPANAREVFKILVANKGDFKKLVKGFNSDPRSEESQRVVRDLAAQLGACGMDLSALAASAAGSDSHGVQLLGLACGARVLSTPAARAAAVAGGPAAGRAPMPLPLGGAAEDAQLDGMLAQLHGLRQQGIAMGQEIDRQDAERRRAEQARRDAAPMPPPASKPPTRRARLEHLGDRTAALAVGAAGFAANARTMAVNVILGDYADRLRALNSQIASGDLADVVAKAVEAHEADDKTGLHPHKVKDFTEALERAISALGGKTAQQIVDEMLMNPAAKWNKGTVGGFFRSLVE